MTTLERRTRWDLRFLALAEFISKWSKDPSTKVGAVIVDPLDRVVSLGFNGLPRHVSDFLPDRLQNRSTKYEMVIHGDVNAILFAQRSLVGCTMYTHPCAPCSRCASIIAQSGITRVVALSLEPEDPLAERLRHDLMKTTFIEAHVRLDLYAGKPG